MAKYYCYCLVSLLSLANKIFAKLINNMFVYHLKTSGIFSDLQYGFGSSSRFIKTFWKCITKTFVFQFHLSNIKQLRFLASIINGICHDLLYAYFTHLSVSAASTYLLVFLKLVDTWFTFLSSKNIGKTFF